MPAEFIERRRQEAWAFGRRTADEFLAAYGDEYQQDPPPLAKIIDEILTDFARARLRFDPMPKTVFAETKWKEHYFEVTVNSLTGTIAGVKDAVGVMNVGKCHELIHIVRDGDELRQPQAQMLPGFGDARSIVCYRSGPGSRDSKTVSREFFAEEAGRAAAVSPRSLRSSPSFQQLMQRGAASFGPVSGGWALLYQTAEDIGVNITALVKQLGLERVIAIDETTGRSLVHVTTPAVSAARAGRDGGKWDASSGLTS